MCVTRFDLKLDNGEKGSVSRAAAKEKARELVDQESRITMLQQDFLTFNLALNGTLSPNAALQNALNMTPSVTIR